MSHINGGNLKSTDRSVSFSEFFSSTKLTILLFVLLGIASIIGTVVIQKGTGEEMHIPDVYSPATIRIFDAIGFFDIYHSGLYLGLLILLAINLCLCTLKRIPIDRRYFNVNKHYRPPPKIAENDNVMIDATSLPLKTVDSTIRKKTQTARIFNSIQYG